MNATALPVSIEMPTLIPLLPRENGMFFYHSHMARIGGGAAPGSKLILSGPSSELCLLTGIALTVTWTSLCSAQQPAKKEFTFRSRVEQVDAATKRLTVANEPIEGWMGQ